MSAAAVSRGRKNAEKSAVKSGKKSHITNPLYPFENKESDDYLAATKPFSSNYRTKRIMLPRKKLEVEITDLDAGHQFIVYGSPLAAMYSAAEVKPEEINKTEQLQKRLSSEDKKKIIGANMRNYRRLAVMSIISVNFRMKSQERCTSDQVSIYRISDPDILFLHKEIKKISGWDTDAVMFRMFLSTLNNNEVSDQFLSFAMIYTKNKDNLGYDFFPKASITLQMAIKTLASNKVAEFELAEKKKEGGKPKK